MVLPVTILFGVQRSKFSQQGLRKICAVGAFVSWLLKYQGSVNCNQLLQPGVVHSVEEIIQRICIFSRRVKVQTVVHLVAEMLLHSVEMGGMIVRMRGDRMRIRLQDWLKKD